MPTHRNPTTRRPRILQSAMSESDVRRMIYYVTHSDEMTIEQLARRFHVGNETIASIRKEHREKAEANSEGEGWAIGVRNYHSSRKFN